MNIYFRVDASVKIGTGHVIRCMALADEFINNRDEVTFICRELKGNLNNFLNKKGYKAIKLKSDETDKNYTSDFVKNKYYDWLGVDWEIDAKQTMEVLTANNIEVDWLIIDHYSIDYNWEKEIRKYVKKIMVIDDLAERKHDCDILLDQNCTSSKAYKKIIPKKCIQLLGYRYALLRQEFNKSRDELRKRDGSIKRILIYFGGSDIEKQIPKALDAIIKINSNELSVDVIAGINNKNVNFIENFCKKNSNFKFYKHINNIVEIVNSADIAICSCGSFTLERYCLGLPAITIEVAENQNKIAKTGSLLGIDYFLGKSSEVSVAKIYEALEKLINTPEQVKLSSSVAKELVDGNGVKEVSTLLRRII